MSSGIIKRSLIAISLLLFVVIGLTGLSTAATLKDSDIVGEARIHSSLNFTLTVQNQSNLNNPELFLKKPKHPWKAYNLSYGGNKLYKNISGSFFNVKGVYNYYFKVDGTRFPYSGGFVVSSGNETLYNASKNFTLVDYSSYNKCDNFACSFENWQAWVFLSQAKAYEQTDNQTYEEASLNFSLGAYKDEAHSKCPPEKGDFSCSMYSGQKKYYGGTKQGALIYSLWRTYDILGNGTVRERAVNYTLGSAEDCNVWNSSFNCNSSRSQGSMMLGYWKAYEMTGNSTYRDIAENLSSTNSSYPRVAEALLFGYSLTGNKSYREKAEEITKEWLEKCPNCSKSEFKGLKKALWRGFKVTGDYGYYGNALLELTASTNSTCSLFGSYSCENGQIQALSSLATWSAYEGKKDVPSLIADPDFDQPVVSGDNLTVKPEMGGRVENLTLKANISNSTFSCSVSFFDGCTIPSEVIYNQSVYSYWFESEDLRFPHNGSLKFATNLINETALQTGREFARADPDDPNCKPWSGDYRCEEEAYQAFTIDLFSIMFGQNSSDTYFNKLIEFVSPPYDESDTNEDSCLPGNNDFSCSNTGFKNFFNGSQRQGLLIRSLFNSYEVTGNETHYQRAMNYTQGSAEDCDVWAGDFRCSNTLGQAEMIKAYWKVYKVTGNATYRQIAVNLSHEALNMNYSSRLGSAMWKTFSYTSNSTYGSYAENLTDNLSGQCSSGCSPEKYSSQGLLLHDAYVYGSESYLDSYRGFFGTSTLSGGCDLASDTSCSNPRQQSLMTELFRKTAYTLPVTLKVETGLDAPSSVKAGGSFDATCSVKNVLRNSTLYDVELAISSSSGLSISGDKTLDKGNLSYSESAEGTWSVEASSSGTQSLTCKITSSSGLNRDLSAEITVEKEETKSTTGSSGSGIVFPGSSEEKSNIPNRTFFYSLTSPGNLSEAFLKSQGLDTGYYNFTSLTSCVTARRKVVGRNMSLSVDYSCKTSESIAVLDKVPENASVPVGGSWVLKRFGNVSSESLGVAYSGNLTGKGWERPYVLSYRKEALDVGLSLDLEANKSAVFVSADLNRKAECRVFVSGDKVYEAETGDLEYNVSLGYGRNRVKVVCGDQSFTRVVNRERPQMDNKVEKDKEGIPLSLIAVLVLGLVSVPAVYYREEIVDTAGMKLFEYRFSKFQEAVDRGDTAEAIKIFDSMSRDVSQEVLESDMDLMQGVLLYVLLDLVEEGKEDDLEMDVSGDLDELVGRYVRSSEGGKASRLVSEKFEDVMGREVEMK